MNHKIVPLPAALHFVATPIGTARDITLRALDILASAEVLAAEDTRSLRKLMEIHGVPLNGRRILSYHDHSGSKGTEHLLAELRAGRSVAYASEAGMPTISDPGYELAHAARAEGLAVTVAPGPSAPLTALAASGLATDAFFFGGFLPSAGGARKARLEAVAAVPATLIFFESPKRTAATLKDMASVLGAGRKAVLARELTKKFEEIRQGDLQSLAEQAMATPPKGEVVLLVARADSLNVSSEDLESALIAAMRDHSLRDAVDLVAAAHDVQRRKVYKMALALSEKGS